jgi:hypothetical protein
LPAGVKRGFRRGALGGLGVRVARAQLLDLHLEQPSALLVPFRVGQRVERRLQPVGDFFVVGVRPLRGRRRGAQVVEHIVVLVHLVRGRADPFPHLIDLLL